MRISRLADIARKAFVAAPELVLNPNAAVQVVRGIHWSSLKNLDQAWLKGLEIPTILDVGANVGQFAAAGRVVFPEARIYSFEPLPDCLVALNNAMKGDVNFTSFNFAIGDEPGEQVIHRSSASASSSLLPMSDTHKEAFPWTADNEDILITVRTLDSFLPELVIEPKVLLKVDVQGFEMHVFRGATETLKQVDLIFVEVSFEELYEGEAAFDEIWFFMREHGFSFRGFLDQLQHPSTGRILQGDAIFERASK